MINIEIWASGAGTNAAVIIDYFQDHERIKVCRLAASKASAEALNKASLRGIDTCVLSQPELNDGTYLASLKKRGIQFIVLAGFLKLVPAQVVQAYQSKILNIHPALLPKYGGKNMYGLHVHQAVLDSGDGKTGITIHEVNEHFDEGAIIAQFETAIDKSDDLDSIRQKVQVLEHKYYPKVIEDFVLREIS